MIKNKPFRLLNKILGKSSTDYAKMARIETKITIVEKRISFILELPSMDGFIKAFDRGIKGVLSEVLIWLPY
jgi:hypothetical protein